MKEGQDPRLNGVLIDLDDNVKLVSAAATDILLYCLVCDTH